MDETILFLLRHGYVVLFLSVSVDQLGLPVPSVPVLLAMGALSGSGEFSLAVDLRHPLEFDADSVKVPGALHLLPEELDSRHHEIPRDRDVVLYCTCPNEATSAMMTLRLHRLGITRVRPLSGGFDAWVEGGFPLEPKTAASSLFAGS